VGLSECRAEPFLIQASQPRLYIVQKAFHHTRDFSSNLQPTPKKKGSWAVKVNQFGEWIQVDLGKMTEVTGVATQGRQDYNEWVTSYVVQFSRDGSNFINYLAGKSFAGNNDRDTVVKQDLKPPVIARYIRLLPKTWRYRWISLRMELYGCN